MQRHEGPPAPREDARRQRSLTRKLLMVVGALSVAIGVLLIKRSYL